MSTLNPARVGMVDKGNILYGYRALLDYTEGPLRMEGEKLTWPQVVAGLKAGKRLTGDCSAFYTEVAEWNGCTDPNGLSFDGYGFTGTLLSNMPQITVAVALPGDAIVFGPAPGLHVVWVTDSHPTNPGVHSPPFDPTIDSHGRPGFDKSDLQTMWQVGFPGQPITVLSLAPFLPAPPPPPKSYHYNRYDQQKIKLPANLQQTAFVQESEAQVVKNYDDERRKPHPNAQTLELQELKLAECVTRLQNNMRDDPKHNNDYWRKWRLPRLVARANGNIVAPD